MIPLSKSRPGFTIVELMVVVTVVGILVSLLLVAVHSMRENARKLSCQNNLKQLGIGLQNHASRTNRLPTVASIEDSNPTRRISVSNPFASLRDELEIRLKITNGVARDWENKTPSQLICPSTGVDLGYRWNCGTDLMVYRIEKEVKENGIIRSKSREQANGLSISEITDGLSNTSAISERMSGDLTSRFPRAIANPTFDFSVETFDEACVTAAEIGLLMNDRGKEWWTGGHMDWSYEHDRPPNSKIWDGVGANDRIMIIKLAARSLHPGIVQAVFVDGSVHTISNNVDLEVWRSLGSVSDGNQVHLP